MEISKVYATIGTACSWGKPGERHRQGAQRITKVRARGRGGAGARPMEVRDVLRPRAPYVRYAARSSTSAHGSGSAWAAGPGAFCRRWMAMVMQWCDSLDALTQAEVADPNVAAQSFAGTQVTWRALAVDGCFWPKSLRPLSAWPGTDDRQGVLSFPRRCPAQMLRLPSPTLA
jgi:hypothetical protein